MDVEYNEILESASSALRNISGRTLEIVDIMKPTTIDYAMQLSKVISKLSPLIGNMIEFFTIYLLNDIDWNNIGFWIRQDPGFPDAYFESNFVQPNPGIEIKAWFPFATEITARFKDSVSFFEEDQINVALIAWLPEFVIYGKPKIIDVLVVSGKSVAQARDSSYHKPPYNIILEPEDTSMRTGNLQQTNTNGYKLQEEISDVEEAQKIVESWGEELLKYSPQHSYQEKMKLLLSKFNYRLDTNYAKIDRMGHKEIEQFKTKVENTSFQGKSIKEWAHILSGSTSALVLRDELNKLLFNM